LNINHGPPAQLAWPPQEARQAELPQTNPDRLLFLDRVGNSDLMGSRSSFGIEGANFSLQPLMC